MSLELWALRGAMAAGALVAAFFYGVSVSNDRHEFKRLQQVEKARETERDWITNTEALEDVKNAEIARITRAHDDLLRQLRERSDRMPEAAAAACKGATGAELSGPDAGFLAGEAAEGARIAAELAECRAWIDEVTKGQPEPSD